MNKVKQELVDYIEDKIILSIEAQIDIEFICQLNGCSSRWNESCKCIEIVDEFGGCFFNIFEGFTRLQAMQF